MTIGGITATVSSWSDSQIVVTVPSGVAPCPVQQQAQYHGSAASCGQLVINTGASTSGTGTATGVTVTDLLPAGLTLVNSNPSQGSYVAATGLWTVGGLANGATATLTLQATVVSPLAQTNTATITHADQFDPDTGNNTASTTTGRHTVRRSRQDNSSLAAYSSGGSTTRLTSAGGR